MFKYYCLVSIALFFCNAEFCLAQEGAPAVKITVGSIEYNCQITNELVEKSNTLLSNEKSKLEDINEAIVKLEAGLDCLNNEKNQNIPSKKAEIMSILGSLYSIKAKYFASNPFKASNFFSTGVRYLDKAVKLEPDNIAVRIRRGVSSVKAPEFLNRAKIARQDLEYVKNHKNFTYLNVDVKRMIINYLLDIYKKSGDQQAISSINKIKID